MCKCIESALQSSDGLCAAWNSQHFIARHQPEHMARSKINGCSIAGIPAGPCLCNHCVRRWHARSPRTQCKAAAAKNQRTPGSHKTRERGQACNRDRLVHLTSGFTQLIDSPIRKTRRTQHAPKTPQREQLAYSCKPLVGQFPIKVDILGCRIYAGNALKCIRDGAPLGDAQTWRQKQSAKSRLQTLRPGWVCWDFRRMQSQNAPSAMRLSNNRILRSCLRYGRW